MTIPKLCRLARTLILWPIDAAATALYHLSLDAIEGFLDTIDAFDQVAAISRDNIPAPIQPRYTGQDYKHAAAIINRTAELRTNPWLDYAEDHDGDLGTSVFTANQPIRQIYPDGSSLVLGPSGFSHYTPNGDLAIHIGQNLDDNLGHEEDDGYAR